MNNDIKRTALIMLLVAGVFIAGAQPRIDSLKKRLASSLPDTNRVTILSDLAINYLQQDVDSSMKFAQEGISLAKKLNFKSGEADCLRRSGIVLYIQGKYPEALDIFQQSLEISESIHHLFGIGASLGHIGTIYAEQGEYSKARYYHNRHLQIAIKIQNIFEQANALVKLGDSYLQQNELDSASIAFNDAYQLVDSLKDRRILGIVYRSLGKIEVQKGNYEKATALFYKAIAYAANDNVLNVLSDTYIELAQIYRVKGLTDSSILYGRKALATGQMNKYAKSILAASRLLAEIYEPINEHEALQYYKLAASIRDSLFNTEKATQVKNLFFLEQQRQAAIEMSKARYNNRLKLYSLMTGLFIVLLVAVVLYNINRTKQKANNLLQQEKKKVEEAFQELRSAQAQLVQSEKMASLGELTAGIAHEIQNPLNFVNNFSDVNGELIGELVDEVDKGNKEEAKQIAGDIKQNLEKITHHGKRADAIVKGMLQHSRTSTGQKELTDINRLADEYLRLAYHGMRAKDKSFNATIKTDFNDDVGKINVVPQDIGRALLNLYNNAFYTVNEKQKQNVPGYEPTVAISSTSNHNGYVEIKVSDNGNGIPQNLTDKIFQPFFTTKPSGQGTGLGLSLAYDIVKAHGGEIKIETKENEGSNFIIQLPDR